MEVGCGGREIWGGEGEKKTLLWNQSKFFRILLLTIFIRFSV